MKTKPIIALLTIVACSAVSALIGAEAGFGMAGGASSGYGAVQMSDSANASAVSTPSTPPVQQQVPSSGIRDVDNVIRKVEQALREAMRHAPNEKEVEKAIEAARKQLQLALENPRPRSLNSSMQGSSGYGGGFGGGAGYGMATSVANHLDPSASSAPDLILTRPLEPATRSEWEEDLRIMDKLVRDKISGIEGNAPRRAMGIKLWFSGHPSARPMYLEDYGVVFSYDVRIALKSSGQETEPNGERTTSSAWEAARTELFNAPTDNQAMKVLIRTFNNEVFGSKAPPKYDWGKVKDLEESLTGLLKEATNIRHLNSDEYVVVTILGMDDRGNPARLTLKTLKADVDELAEGKITQEAFIKKIATQLE